MAQIDWLCIISNHFCRHLFMQLVSIYVDKRQINGAGTSQPAISTASEESR